MSVFRIFFILMISFLMFACSANKEGSAPSESDPTVPVESPTTELKLETALQNFLVNSEHELIADGGVPPYVFEITQGSGVLVPVLTSAVYTAPAVPGQVIIKLTDAAGTEVSTTYNIYSLLQITPQTLTLSPSGTTNVVGTGGLPPYLYSLVSGGGVLNDATGAYTAPSVAGTVVLRVVDSIGQSADATITVVDAAPTISVISDQVVNEDETLTVAFTINDVDSVLDCATSVTAASTQPSLVPISAIQFSGTAPNCTATISPAAQQNGAVNLTFTVTDGSSSAQENFLVTVNPVNDAPVLSAISNQILKSDSSLVINYHLTDVDGALDCVSSVTLSTSNPAVLPMADIVKSGAAPNCIITITPSLNVAGLSTVGGSATDGALTDSKSFTATVVNVASIGLSPSSLNLAVGGNTQLQATAYYSDASSGLVTSNTNASWASSNSAVASVNNTTTKGLVSGVASGSANTSLSYKGLSQSVSATVYAVNGVTLSTGSVTGGIGAQTTVAATAQTATYSFDVSSSATWSSSNPAVATVSSNGVIQFISAGNAVVTASYAGYSANVNVTVQSKSLVSLAIAIAGGGTSVPVNGMKNLIVTGTYSDATTEVLTNTAVWSSSNNSVLSVSNTLPTIGKVTGLAAGTSTVSAVIGSVTGTMVVTVNAVTLSSIAINPNTALVASGATYNLRATGTYSDASSADITELVTWSSSNTTAATVSNVTGSKGLATTPTFSGYRSTNLSATLSGVTGTTVFGVNGATINSIVVTPVISLTVNQIYNLKAYGNLSDGGVIDLTDFAIWSSSNISNVSVSNALGSKGSVTGVAMGTSTVTAAFNGVNGSRVVTVAAASNVSEVGVGLTGAYYTWTGGPPPASAFLSANKKGERIDQKINFAWASGNAPMGVGDQFSVRWTGFYKATSATNYFCTNSDDGVRVWINGTLVINNWTEHGPMWDCTANIPLVVGTKYSVVIEYYENGGGSEAHLTRSSVSAADAQSTTARAIPQIDLYPN